MADEKSDTLGGEGDIEFTLRTLYNYAYLHLFQYGYLSDPARWIHYTGTRIEIFKYFGMDHFSSSCGDPDWRKNKRELEAWTCESAMTAFMLGNSCVDKEYAPKLRKKIMPKFRSVGLWMATYDALGWRTTNEKLALQLLRDYGDELDLDYVFYTTKNPKDLPGPNRPAADSILSFAIRRGAVDFVGLLLDTNTHIKLDEFCDLARSLGQWKIYQKLELARLGRSQFQRVEQEKIRVEKRYAIVDAFMRGDDLSGGGAGFKSLMRSSEKSKNQNIFMDEIVGRLCTAISEFQPVSEELILIAWRYSLVNCKDPLKSKIWIALKEVCNTILTIPLDKVRWRWFLLYFLNSAIWLEPVGDHSLYDELVKVVDKQWQVPKDHLKKHITKIENTKEWADLIGIEDKAPKSPGELRQDFYIQSAFNEKELRNMSLQAGANILDYYDMTGYLSDMVIRAYELDHAFHSSMRRIFHINPITQQNGDGSILYTGGPVKTGDRCQMKAQSDYAKEQCPTVANIVDIIRGSLVFKDVAGLLQAYDVLVKAINSGKYAIQRIVRVKNSLRKNEEKRRKQGVYRYGDIKLNVLIAVNKKMIVGEIQMMTRFILEAKKMDHELYEIVRRRGFVENVKNSLKLSTDKQQAFVMAAIEADTAKMMRLYVNYPYPSIDPFLLDDSEKGYGIIHRICANGNSKGFSVCLKFFIKKDQVPKMVDLKAKNGDSPLMVVAQNCRTNGHYQIIKKLLSPKSFRKYVNINHQNKDGQTALHLASQNGRALALKLLLEDDEINPNLRDKDAWSALMGAVKHRQPESNKLLYRHPKVDVKIGMKSGSTPFMIACFNGYDEIAREHLKSPRVTVGFRRPDGVHAWRFATQNGCAEVLKLLVERPEIRNNWNKDYGYGSNHADANAVVEEFKRKWNLS